MSRLPSPHLSHSHPRPLAGSRIGAWDRVDRSGLNSYNQLWFIDPVDVADSPYDARYTIRNLRAGTYMDLANSTFRICSLTSRIILTLSSHCDQRSHIQTVRLLLDVLEVATRSCGTSGRNNTDLCTCEVSRFRMRY